MVTHRRIERTNRPLDFFISYSPADERWATWIAWELETAGYSTMLQAWDFVPGTNFIDFMDRGVTEASVVVSVLSRNYLTSRYGRLEWQAALRADPDDVNRLVTVRVEDCPLEGLLSMITYLDLLGVTDPKAAQEQLLKRTRQAVAGRAKPANRPGYPPDRTTRLQHEDEPGAPLPLSERTTRRTPGAAPLFPPAAPASPGVRSALTMLHLPGPRFGRSLVPSGVPATPEGLQARIYGDLTRLTSEGAPAPDLLVVTGDVTETGSVREFAAATEFLTGLRVLLGLEPHRLIIVPGGHDITRSACRAYFASCVADDVPPKPPFWPKWRHFTRLFEELYQGLDDLAFDSQQPWTLFAVPDLQVVIAGLNSTINDSHRDDDHYGWIGEAQAAWFAQRLRSFEQAEWLRIGVIRHGPAPSGSLNPAQGIGLLRDSGSLDRLLSRRLNLLLHGPVEAGTAIRASDGELPLIPPAGPDRWQLVQITAGRLTRIPCPPPDAPPGGPAHDRASTNGKVEEVQHQWPAARGTFAPTHPTDPAVTVSTPSPEPSAPEKSTLGSPTRRGCCWIGSPKCAWPDTTSRRSGSSKARYRTCWSATASTISSGSSGWPRTPASSPPPTSRPSSVRSMQPIPTRCPSWSTRVRRSRRRFETLPGGTASGCGASSSSRACWIFASSSPGRLRGCAPMPSIHPRSTFHNGSAS